MIEICDGCGRRATEEEQSCAACGRPLRGTDLGGQPQGWLLAPELTAPALGPARHDQAPAQVPGAPAVDVAELFRARPSDGAPVLDGQPGATPAAEAIHRPQTPGSSIGGRGWRVRAGAAVARADAAGLAAQQAPALAVVAPGARVPPWLFALLIASIIATSSAAVALVVAHILRSSS